MTDSHRSSEDPRDLEAYIAKEEEPYHEFWYRFGRFIHRFAHTETHLILLLYNISGLPSDKAGAIFSGVRAEGARDFINNILDATGQFEKKNRLYKPFAQMAAIGTIRNNLVHWGVTVNNIDGFDVTNMHFRPIKPKLFGLTLDDLNNLDRDLCIIEFCLDCEMGATCETAKFQEYITNIAWLYKPPQPTPSSSKRGRRRSK